MDVRIFYIVGFIVVSSYAENCRTSQESPCDYTLFCTNYVNVDRNWDSFAYYGRNSMHGKMCVHNGSYEGYELYPVKLIFKQTDINITEPIPPVLNEWRGRKILNIIHTLDLSGNNYYQPPIIQTMLNLVILNISKNELTSAVLSNKNELVKLTKIDLSNNMISDIKVNHDEYPYKQLTVIDLSHNYITNIPDAIFDSMDGLHTLDLSYNFLDILGQFNFEGIKKLANLNLSNNRLIDINSSLFRFSELKILNLSGNKLKDLTLNDFKQLMKLETLDLSSNNIKTINSNVFSPMVSLQRLDLSNNLLDSLDKNTFTNLNLLNNIDLSNNKIKTLPIGLFNNITLSTFSVSANILEGSLDRGMFEGINVTRLDLSNQMLTEIKDYTFYNLFRLDTLIFKSNKIESLTDMCFKTLINLRLLDLSYNKITNINFDKADLSNLQSFSLKNNRLTKIEHKQFQHLNHLEYLDLSENLISHIEPNAFQMLSNLIHLELNNNPLVGTLEAGTFQGLVLLPSLDVSRSMLTTIENASFSDMSALRDLNISHCEMSEIKYNAFVHTGHLETLDLSHNKLKDFNINTTELFGLSTLLLHNNLLKNISSTTLRGLSRLNKCILSNNDIIHIDTNAFKSLIDLRHLDLSYNTKCNFTVTYLAEVKELTTLILSGIKTPISFAHLVEDSQITDLVMANASIQNISQLQFGVIPHIDTLDVSNNNVSNLQIGDFSGLSALRHLDLSFNQISSIQPGVFKNNTVMYSLNISHNCLVSINYGIFRGLIYLSVLDLSYNYIKDLESERFYELNYLTQLIVDHNHISSVNAEEFIGTSLTKLSIGDNPLPCEILVKLAKSRVPFEITAIRIDEHANENVNGVTCNKLAHMIIPTSKKTENSSNILLDSLQNVLFNLSKSNIERDNRDIEYLEKISTLLEKSNSLNHDKLTNLVDLSASVKSINNRTNLMLENILNLFNKNHPPTASTTVVSPTTILSSTSTHFPSPDNNNQSVEIISYINKVKKELENAIVNQRRNIMTEFENKIASNRTESLPKTSVGHEKLVSSNIVPTTSLFTETCVALTLFILVGLVLYKFYKSRMFIRNRFSISTRELPGAMENSTL